MWKIAILLFIAGCSSVSCQQVLDVNCSFYVSFWDEYICRVTGADFQDGSVRLNFVGEHIGNLTNADVIAFEVYASNWTVMHPDIFTTFPNIIELDINRGGLTNINIPDSVRLERLYLSNNNLSRIAVGDLTGQQNLQIIVAINSRIAEIEAGAFEGLGRLDSLVLIGNEISTIAPGTLRPLVNLTRIDFERNRLTRIEEDTFETNTRLSTIYFEYNQINEVAPRFAHPIRDTLEYINFRGNVCANRSFDIESDFGMIILNNVLNPCFNNFQGVTGETRRVTFEFQGSLSLFDEFGNIIARVN